MYPMKLRPRRQPSIRLQEMAALRSTQATFAQVAESMKGKIESLLAQPPSLTSAKRARSFEQWKPKPRPI